MDAPDAATVALMTCRTYDEAVAQVGHEALEASIRRAGWAILAAPDIYLLVSEWMQIRRLDDAEQDLIRSRELALSAALAPEALSEEDGSVGKDAIHKRTKRTGADVIAIAVNAVTKNVEAHGRHALIRLKCHESLSKRIAAVVWRIHDLRKGVRIEAARDALLGYMATTDPRLETALAIARVYNPGPARMDPETGDPIDARTGQRASRVIEQALPAVVAELDQLRAARDRAMAAGDFGSAIGLGAEIRDIEVRQNGGARRAEEMEAIMQSLAKRLPDLSPR